MNVPYPRPLTLVLIFIFVTQSCSLDLWAQESTYADRTRAVDVLDSRGEEEAERTVSLSADKIIALLEHEPGLLLQVKKLLVRKAYEQGRVLDPNDLTDEALFRLIGKDETVRIVITQEIVDRGYVPVRPTWQEIQREEQEWQAARNGRSAVDTSARASGGAGEEKTTGQTVNASKPKGQDKTSGPTASPSKPNEQQNMDARRLLEQAQGTVDSLGGLPLSVLPGQTIAPDELGSLLSSRLSTSKSSFPSLASTNVSWDKFPGAAGGVGDLPPSMAQLPKPTAAETPSAQTDLKPAQMPKPAFHEERPMLSHRTNPYADVPSLYDLYSQYSAPSPALERFGTDVFRNGTGNSNQLPMDLPAGPEYIVGPGDGLSIDLWGGISQRLTRTVDRDGRLALPEVGAMQVAGRALGEVQHLVQTVLRTQLRGVQVDVSIAKLRTIRVYVVGDVEHPGAYDISSLSTPLNALYEAGGPTSRGSMRIIKHYRGKQLIENVDLYELLLQGVRSNMARLESGDTVLVPPALSQITIAGMVRRAAIYELDGEKSLAEALQLAGGVLPTGTIRHVDVERVVAHERRTMLQIDVPETNNDASVTKALEDFQIQDGDQIRISPIVAFSDKTVYLDGHVFRPGKYAYREGMKVTDLIKSYSDLLSEPYGPHAEIIRLRGPDYKPEVLSFNLDNALVGKEQDLLLRPFDTVRVFGRFDFEDPPVISVTGAVRDPGDHVTNGATYLRDAIYLAGNTTPDAQLDDAQVFRKTADGKLKVISVELSKALAGDLTENILLRANDRVFVHQNLTKADPPTVSIQGEVSHPGKYRLGENMSARDLVRIAGGLKRSAFTREADLTTYMIQDGDKVVSEHRTVPLAKALANEPDSDVRLHDGDVLTIRQLSGWNDRGAMISVQGEVVHPGTYGIQEGERLSSILERAGGFREDAYPYGAIFERAQVRELEEKNRAELIRRVQAESAGEKSLLDLASGAKDTAQYQWKNTLDKLQNTPPAGRVVIHISSNLKRWANTANDIPVRAGDTVYVPKRPNFVVVDGAVYNSTAITFKPGKDAGWYLRQAGGTTNMANKKAIFVVRADGSVMGRSGNLFLGSVLNNGLQPGDMLVVPEKAVGGGFSWRSTLQVAQLVSAVGIAVQVARGF